MQIPELNYKHLRYFWAVVNEGSVAKAAERLGVSPQTISGQLGKLEKSIGRALLQPSGRRLELTEAGREALRYADEIFRLGERLQEAMADPLLGRAQRLTLGIADSVPKLVAYQVLAPLLSSRPQLRMICHEGEFDDLISALTRHKVDLVLSDRELSHSRQRRMVATRLASCPIGIYASRDLLARQGVSPGLDALAQGPLLLPSKRSSLRGRLDAWLEAEGLQPHIAGEFDDLALLTTFGGHGAGYFPAATLLSETLSSQYNAELVTSLPELREDYYAISLPTRLPNPLIQSLLQQAWPT